MKKIYLDNAASTFLDTEVKEVMVKFMGMAGNPSSTHQYGREAKNEIEKARKSIAKHLNISSKGVVFTGNGTEANNFVLKNAVQNLKITTIITSKIEHFAVLKTIESLHKETAVEVLFVDLDEKGGVNYNHLEQLLQENKFSKTLVSLMHINNEVGNILDIDCVSNLCKQNNALFHSDTIQSVGKYVIDLQKTPIDFITISAHKFHGPKGVGCCIVNGNYSLKPLVLGGGQEKGLRAGTEDIIGILGMEKALSLSIENLNFHKKQILAFKKYAIQQLKLVIPSISFNGYSENEEFSSYNIINISVPSADPMLLFTLDLKGIAVSSGSACQSGGTVKSHVVKVIHPEKNGETPVRISLSKYNTKAEIDLFVEILSAL